MMWLDSFSPLLLAALIFGGALASLELHARVRRGRPWKVGWRVVKGQPGWGPRAPWCPQAGRYAPGLTDHPWRPRGEG